MTVAPVRKWTETRGRAVVRARSAGICEVAGFRADSIHHRQNRSQGGTWAPSNLLHLNGSGSTGVHGWITENPKLACAAGLTVPSWQDPATVPVFLRLTSYWPGWWLLDDHGLYVTSTVEEAVAAGLPERPVLPEWAEWSKT